jgi:hypothetical protein
MEYIWALYFVPDYFIGIYYIILGLFLQFFVFKNESKY